MPAYTPIEVIVSTDLPSVTAENAAIEVVSNTSLPQLVAEIQTLFFVAEV